MPPAPSTPHFTFMSCPPLFDGYAPPAVTGRTPAVAGIVYDTQ